MLLRKRFVSGTYRAAAAGALIGAPYILQSEKMLGLLPNARFRSLFPAWEPRVGAPGSNVGAAGRKLPPWPCSN